MNHSSSDENTLRISHHGSVPLKRVELSVVAGANAGLRARFCQPRIGIGTAPDNDVVLTDRLVSRHHLELCTTPEGLMLRDLWSTNGTYIGGRRITELSLTRDILCSVGSSLMTVRPGNEEQEMRVPATPDNLGALVGTSPPMRKLFSLVRAVAPTQATVLIQGESGTGKELVARTLHELSGRTGPLVTLDASVVDPALIRSDLFGHVKGAYTGASGPREGAFRRAGRGTLFIDEIGELPLDLQPRLLRALETREVTPVGSDCPLPVDVRVIAATHRDLLALVKRGQFRADLYYRLSVVQLRVPALREIVEDIPALVQHLLAEHLPRYRVSSEAMEALTRYHWPGNVRELRNVLERAAVFCVEAVIGPEHLGLPHDPEPGADLGLTPLPLSGAALQEWEQSIIKAALMRNAYNKEKTARELRISPSTLRRKLKSLVKDEPVSAAIQC